MAFPTLEPMNAGGGVWNAGKLTLEKCKISENHLPWVPWPYPTLSAGGGVYNDHLGTAVINDCTISGNEAYFGAGIYNMGLLTVNGGVISGNYGAGGGGIYSDYYPYPDPEPKAKVDMSHCVITGNIAYYWGGGIENWAPMTLTDCMISGNVALPTGWVDQGPIGGYIGGEDVLVLKGSTQIIDNTPINIKYV